MVFWKGRGAARALAHEDDALLLERATGDRSLAAMSRDDDDDEACRIICATAAALHANAAPQPSHLVPLESWFRSLTSSASDGALGRCADIAKKLLSTPQDVVTLHGDLHHGNILDFGEAGWLAIDPKGLIGERGFDFANLFCNPDHEVALVRGRMGRRVAVVSEAAGLDQRRLIEWIAAWAALSAIWTVEDDQRGEPDLSIVEAALGLIDS